MIPCKFKEQTHTLGKPEGVSDKECGGLPVVATDLGFSSCWEMTEDEWLDLRNNGFRLWLTVYGQAHPTVSLTVEKPFQPTQAPSPSGE